MSIFADVADVDEAFEGSIDPSMADFVENRVEAAESLLITMVPRLGLGGLTDLDVANAKRVVCEAVLRVVRNPGGALEEKIGPFSMRLAAAGVSGGGTGLYFTEDELAAFRRSRRKRFGVAGIAGPRWSETS